MILLVKTVLSMKIFLLALLILGLVLSASSYFLNIPAMSDTHIFEAVIIPAGIYLLLAGFVGDGYFEFGASFAGVAVGISMILTAMNGVRIIFHANLFLFIAYGYDLLLIVFLVFKIRNQNRLT